MLEIALPQSQRYKGSISWFKLKLDSGACKIEKRRPFGWDAYKIEPDEFEWCQTAKQAEALWGFYHYQGTAAYYSGQVRHPMGKQFPDQAAA